MVISNDGRWCICTPKKTGTHSLNAALSNVAYVHSPWHSRESLDMYRIMPTRDDLERFVSMYYFARRVKSAWNKKFSDEPNRWVEAFFAGDNLDWQLTIPQYAEKFKPHFTFDIDDWTPFIELMLSFDIIVDVKHLNRTKSRPPVDEFLASLTDTNRNLVEEWKEYGFGNN